MVSDNQTVRAVLADPGFWAAATHLPGNSPTLVRGPGRPAHLPGWALYLIACVAGYLGSQRGAIAYFSDPVMWDVIRVWAQPDTPSGWRALPAKPPTRAMLRTFLKRWDSPEWVGVRHRVEKAQMGAAMTEAKHLGHFQEDRPLAYNKVDFRQWVTTDGTVLKAPSDHSPDEDTPHRTDDASGLHSKGGSTARGSKFVLIETISDEYRGRYIVAAAHVTPKAGKQQGDEAAPTVTALLNLKQDAPGMWGNICDTVLRGSHIKTLARAGIVTVNIPPAQENPDRKTKGRNSDKRVERTQYLRTHRHTLTNGHVCEHRLHTVGSVPHQEAYDDEGHLILVPLPNGFAGKAPQNADGSYRWYVAYQVPCPHSETSVWLRIDGPGHADTKGWAWTDLMRLYPVGTPQYGLLYGRRNATESLHRQYKRKAERVPAYGYTRQLLFVLGYIATHNAVARAFHLRRAGKPNALDGLLRT